MAKNKEKVSRIFTLSAYGTGNHAVDGRTPAKIRKQDDDYSHPSFAESLSPISTMIAEIGNNIPTGTKIKVTMEVVG